MAFGGFGFDIGIVVASAIGGFATQPAPPALSCAAPASAATVRLASASPISPPVNSDPTHGRAIVRAPDGLFYVDATINGAKLRLLVDTGATDIILTRADAARAGVRLEDGQFDEKASTAGGETNMARVQLHQVAVNGSLDWNVPAVVAGGALNVSLLGARWLTRIGSVTITGDRMILQ